MNYTIEEIIQAQELFPTGWIDNHKIKNESGLPIEFVDHRFLIAIYNDMSPLQAVLKPPQIGMTVLEIIKSMYVSKNLKKDIIYTLPTQSDVNDMAGGKINRIVAQNPILSKWVKEHDTVEQKSVGENIIYYRGTFSTKQAMMVSSQLNIHDEVDASNAEVITQYETRLQANAGGWRWYFSHPSLEGFGVDIWWQKSDKKEWFILCPHCQKEQYLDFPNNIDMEKGIYICNSCKGELSDDDRRAGIWKPTATGEFSGYHISQLMCPWITAEKIITDFKEKDRQYFYNYVLGLAYAGSDAKISSRTVLKNVIKHVNTQDDRIIIGVDTGLPIHYSMMNKQGFFYFGKCKEPSATYDPYDELEGYLKRWKNSIIISDQGGDLIGIRKLQAKYPGRVFLCYYRQDRKSKEYINWGEGENYGIVTVDRNRMFQIMVDQLRDIGRIKLNGTVEDWQEWAEMFDNVYRTTKDTQFGPQYVWERNGPDHYCHTALYALVGFDRFAENLAQVIKSNDTFMDGVQIGKNFNIVENL